VPIVVFVDPFVDVIQRMIFMYPKALRMFDNNGEAPRSSLLE
jgi:hypothetical protein